MFYSITAPLLSQSDLINAQMAGLVEYSRLLFLVVLLFFGHLRHCDLLENTVVGYRFDWFRLDGINI